MALLIFTTILNTGCNYISNVEYFEIIKNKTFVLDSVAAYDNNNRLYKYDKETPFFVNKEEMHFLSTDSIETFYVLDSSCIVKNKNYSKHDKYQYYFKGDSLYQTNNIKLKRGQYLRLNNDSSKLEIRSYDELNSIWNYRYYSLTSQKK